MNTRLTSTFLVVALTLFGCASGDFQPSRHYAEVTKHLDVGGDVLFYADVDGDLATAADYLDRLIERIRKLYPDLGLERIKAKRILNQLGLDQVLAIGLSSARDGKAFHNKAFFFYGKDRRGLLLLTGAPPQELEIPRLAPADVDLAFESDLRIKSLVSLIEAMVADLAGKEVSALLLAGQNQKLPGVALTVRQVLDRLDTRLVGLVRVNEQRTFTVGGKGKLVLPTFDVLLSLDDMGTLFDAYRGLLQALPYVASSIVDDAIDASCVRPLSEFSVYCPQDYSEIEKGTVSCIGDEIIEIGECANDQLLLLRRIDTYGVKCFYDPQSRRLTAATFINDISLCGDSYMVTTSPAKFCQAPCTDRCEADTDARFAHLERIRECYVRQTLLQRAEGWWPWMDRNCWRADAPMEMWLVFPRS
jgi:hypothetical protein